MLMVRILNGQQAGQMFQLQAGANLIGRAPSCHIKILSPGVSKEHAKIDVYDDKLIVSDMGSRNGTFINGVQVKSQKFQVGDKIVLHDVVIEIAELPAQAQMPMPSSQPYPPQTPGAYQGNLAYQQNFPPQAAPHYHPQAQAGEAIYEAPNAYAYEESSEEPESEPKVQLFSDLKKVVVRYIDNVVLPGVYKVGEILEFKWTLALFMAGFILFVTSLSSIPLMTILKDSIQQESTNRALTIGRTLARFNRSSLMEGMESALSVDLALREPGVEEALIISNVDGNIMAPAAKSGKYPEEPFIHEARKLGNEATQQVDDDTIIAMVPIEFYNPETGSQSVTAYAVVIYNMGALAVDGGKTFSLFIQTFFIALVVGSILFFFLYKLIEHPIRSANAQLDKSLREGYPDLEVNFEFPAFQDLLSNITSALTRIGSGSDDASSPVMEADRNIEMANIVELIGFPAMAINAHDHSVAAVNPAFEERTGFNAADLVQSTVEAIHDQALKLSIEDLLERVSQQPDQMATNDLEFSGDSYQVAAQSVYGTNQVAYFLIVLLPMMDGGES